MIEFGARIVLQDQMIATIQKNISAQKQLQRQVEETRAALDRASQARHQINMDGSAAKREADKVKEAVNRLKNPVQAKVEANVQAAQQRLNAVKEKMDSLKNKVVSPVIDARDKASAIINKVKSKATTLKNMALSPVIRAKDAATGIISNVTDNPRGGIFHPYKRACNHMS